MKHKNISKFRENISTLFLVFKDDFKTFFSIVLVAVVVGIVCVSLQPVDAGRQSNGDRQSNVMSDSSSNMSDISENSRFRRDGKVIIDPQTGLEWVYISKLGNWYDARRVLANSTFAGGGWRMPTMDELKTFCEESKRAGDPWDGMMNYVWSGETGSYTHHGYPFDIRIPAGTPENVACRLFKNSCDVGDFLPPKVELHNFLAVRS